MPRSYHGGLDDPHSTLGAPITMPIDDARDFRSKRCHRLASSQD